MKPSNKDITLIGNDPSLAYLIGRFAEQSGYRLTVLKGVPSMEEIWSRKPCMILFASMDSLESGQFLLGEMADGEILVGVCASLSDEARARELGADRCLLHPLTYDGFMATVKGNEPPGILGSGRSASQPDSKS